MSSDDPNSSRTNPSADPAKADLRYKGFVRRVQDSAGADAAPEDPVAADAALKAALVADLDALAGRGAGHKLRDALGRVCDVGVAKQHVIRVERFRLSHAFGHRPRLSGPARGGPPAEWNAGVLAAGCADVRPAEECRLPACATKFCA